MAAIRSKDIKPEMIVRKYLFSRELRFRILVKSLPGKPDIVLPKIPDRHFHQRVFLARARKLPFLPPPEIKRRFPEREKSTATCPATSGTRQT